MTAVLDRLHQYATERNFGLHTTSFDGGNCWLQFENAGFTVYLVVVPLRLDNDDCTISVHAIPIGLRTSVCAHTGGTFRQDITSTELYNLLDAAVKQIRGCIDDIMEEGFESYFAQKIANGNRDEIVKAIRALTQIPTESSIQLVVSQALAKDPYVRMTVAEQIGRDLRRESIATEVLHQLMADDDDWVRAAAEKALSQIENVH